MNKMNELCTLCDIQGCIIIYSAYEPQPTVWPSPFDAQQIISRFRELPELEQTQRLYNQESYMIQRVQKSYKQAEKLQRINRLTDMEILMHQCVACLSSLQNVPLNDITEMGRLAEQNIQDIMARMEELEKNQAATLQMGGTSSNPPRDDAAGPSFRN
ncbi:Hypothetical predicted protein [Olea europaea subsp. europaea]|uniref:Uncharacterized protein n=1 Tax=Olea europaea subsp. europaea TaxID=158383 RepID=A0A8S0VBI9_OLEEU|nr:Hypothetical predicted protein [Olea europaea subsp. europaea]